MVYAVCVKVIGHFAESGHKPCVVITGHILPIICGHTPFLAVNGKGVGRCACLAVCMEKFRMDPDVTAVTVYAYRYVSFKQYTFAVCIFLYISKLLVQMELYETV